jgi:hypothetical protein
MEYSGWGSSWATMARPIAMMAATMPSIRSVLLSLAGLRLRAQPLARVLATPHPCPLHAEGLTLQGAAMESPEDADRVERTDS